MVATGFVFGTDAFLLRHGLPRPIEAILDESAHLITALLLADGLGRTAREVLIGGALGATMLDADHIPMELGRDLLTRDAGRPVTHSLPALCLLSLAAAASGRWRLRIGSAAFGLATHMVRDLATGGMPLWWPLTRRKATIPYAWYAALLIGLLAAGNARRIGVRNGY